MDFENREQKLIPARLLLQMFPGSYETGEISVFPFKLAAATSLILEPDNLRRWLENEEDNDLVEY